MTNFIMKILMLYFFILQGTLLDQMSFKLFQGCWNIHNWIKMCLILVLQGQVSH
jgi:hypothetical protein